jgi:hypothetical protein
VNTDRAAQLQQLELGEVLQLLDRSVAAAQRALDDAREVVLRAQVLSQDIRERAGHVRTASGKFRAQVEEVVRKAERDSQRPVAS